MAQLAVGDLLEDRYRIDHPIARGGMSMVWRCVDLRLGRAVAAKVLDEKYIADPVFRQRFRREARAMAQLNHPNLVNVYDFGSDGDHLYLIMELITGGTLRELLAERGIPVTTWDGWHNLDAAERALGEAEGRERKKIVEWDQMVTSSHPEYEI